MTGGNGSGIILEDNEYKRVIMKNFNRLTNNVTVHRSNRCHSMHF